MVWPERSLSVLDGRLLFKVLFVVRSPKSVCLSSDVTLSCHECSVTASDGNVDVSFQRSADDLWPTSSLIALSYFQLSVSELCTSWQRSSEGLPEGTSDGKAQHCLGLLGLEPRTERPCLRLESNTPNPNERLEVPTVPVLDFFPSFFLDSRLKPKSEENGWVAQVSAGGGPGMFLHPVIVFCVLSFAGDICRPAGCNIGALATTVWFKNA